MATEALGSSLLTIARNAIGKAFDMAQAPIQPHPDLQQLAATFVTLTQQGRLRGCIGSLEAHRRLEIDVAENALAAAFRDPRFSPLTREELSGTRIEVSLLSPATPMKFESETDALTQLRPGVDGLILSCGGRRATFLPQVWESLPAPRQFMKQLKLKAGFPAEFWSADIRLSRYGAQKWKET